MPAQISGATCVALDPETTRRAAQEFRRFGILRVTNLLNPETTSLVRAETNRLLEQHSERRDLRLATTDFTRRSMSVVPSEKVAAHSDAISMLYQDADLLAMLEAIAGEKLHPCPKKDEEFLITRHERKGDTHGWHWGDFSYALIWVPEAPPIEVGGLLQCIAHTSWNKADPKINQYIVENPITTYYFASGDAYLLRTDTTLHRTIPFREDAVRVILNMTWAAARDLRRTYTTDDRWWDNADATAAVSVRGDVNQGKNDD
ncbi:L-lysine 4-chlorinase [Frankia sp. AiPs1]|uniref:L-lysine 4-chlorinase BesD n=1 Tax=Frankia sp. AiPa1 TaxID=573492 RepID=UPI00202B463A|nr:L-lysine 4-chlorinase BesD [Frankia sp. AiPa1]MCL9759637.1 hypothetical protein [Frankia sp. AiPa1]